LILQALEFLVELEAAGIDKTGYAFMTGGRMIGRSAGSAFDQPPPDMAELEAAFVKVWMVPVCMWCGQCGWMGCSSSRPMQCWL
jgi:hypothetical protein